MQPGLRIIVTGLIAQHPGLAGVAWDYLQYPAGLAALGHDVYYFEDSGQWPYNLDGGTAGDDWIAADCRRNIDHLHATLARFGLGDRWAYRFPTNQEWFGLSDRVRREVISSADVLINVSGTLEWPDRYREIPRLVYVDSDPVFTQVRLVADPSEFDLTPEEELEERKFKGRVAAHDVHFSFGESFSADVPVTPYRWHPTRQPILLDEWRPSGTDRGVFTTIMSWTSYTPLRFDNKTYGQKDIEFRRFLNLPLTARDVSFEVAVNSTRHARWEQQLEDGGQTLVPSPAASDLLRANGWHVVDAGTSCGDLDTYRDFVETSRGEWSVAKNGYVVGRPGWFSCRSACYLAAGRPVVVQDTGFTDIIPAGEGLFAFTDAAGAVDAIHEVQSDYAHHSAAARSLAEEYFDSDEVLTKLLEDSFDGTTSRTFQASSR